MSKYKNPISKPATVKVPKWEFAALVTATAHMDIVQKIVNCGDKYKAMDMLEILFKDQGEGGEE